MKKYTVPTLNSKTPKAEQTKLLTALKGLKGVETAQLYPAASEFSITTREKQEVKREDIASAASGAGFALSAKQ